MDLRHSISNAVNSTINQIRRQNQGLHCESSTSGVSILDQLESRVLFDNVPMFRTVTFSGAQLVGSAIQVSIQTGITADADSGYITLDATPNTYTLKDGKYSREVPVTGSGSELDGEIAAAGSVITGGSFTYTPPGGTATTTSGGGFVTNAAHTGSGYPQTSSTEAPLGGNVPIVAYEDGTDFDYNDAYVPVQVSTPHACDCDNTSSNPISYYNGAIDMSETDLAPDASGPGLGVMRSWTNDQGQTTAGLTGNGTVLTQLPSLNLHTGSAQIVQGGTSSAWFNSNGSGGFTADFGATDSLTQSGSGSSSEFQWTDPSGQVTRFYAFDSSIPAAQQGQFKGFTAAGSSSAATISTTYNSGGQLTQVLRAQPIGGGNVANEAYNYTYLTSGVNAGKIQSVTFQRGQNGTGYSTVRAVTYSYYDGSTINGNAGDLATAVVTGPSSAVISTQYYRYYAPRPVSSLTYNSSTGIATATLSGHGLAVGDSVTIAGADQTQLDQTFVVTAVTSTTFSFKANGSPPATATGTITAITGGYKGGLKYFFNNADYGRLASAVSNPLTATDAQVAPYASNYYKYDGTNQQVTAEAAEGAGTFGYSYSYSSGNVRGYNSWFVKNVETLPDGNTNTVYSNVFGQQILKVYTDTSTGHKWGWFTAYDANGNAVLSAQPSAVALPSSLSTLEQYADILHQTGTSSSGYGTYQYLSDSAGLINLTDYYASTTATSSAAGGVALYVHDTKVEHGDTGTPILQNSEDYFARSDGTNTVYPVADDTRYRNTDGTGAQTTSYSYTWYSGTVQKLSVTTTSPVVSSGQNGPGTSDVTTDVYDPEGRVIWSKDADGFLTYNAYDAQSRALVKTIKDVDTSNTSDYDTSTLPSGWSTPSGGGLNLVTSYVVDSLGRTTQETSPGGNVTYTVYDDANHAQRVYPGWHQDLTSGLWTTTGPVQVIRDDLPNNYSESLTYAYTPASGVTVPTGTDTIANLQTLSRTLMNGAGQVVETDAYFDLSGITYSTTSSQLGSVNVNYYATTYGYDVDGNQNRQVAPTGTITRTVYDGQGRALSSWIGTNDTPSSGTWSPTNNTGTSNMVRVGATTYDNGGVGDSNVTQQTQYPGGTAAARATQYLYDWRDRQIAAKQGAAPTLADETAVPGIPLSDGGFESPSVGSGSSAYSYDPTGTPWTYSGYAGVSGNGSAFTSGNSNAPEGAQVGFVQITGSMSQSLSLAAGTYAVSFLAVKRGNGGGNEDFRVSVDGTSVGTFKPSSTSYDNLVTAEFTVTAGSHTIAFTGLDTAGGDNTAFIDAVKLLQISHTAAATVGNSGFESPSVGSGSGAYAYDPTGTPWTYSGYAGVSGNSSGFTSGNPNAPEGSQVGLVQMTGSVSQSVTFNEGNYVINFKAAQRGSNAQNFNVLIDGVVVGTFKPIGSSYSTLVTSTFYVTAGTHTLTFAGVNSAGGDNTAFFDAVQVDQVVAPARVHRPITVSTLDNLGEATATFAFDGDGIALSDFAGGVSLTGSGSTIAASVDAGVLRGYSTSSFDDQGRAYRNGVYSVDPITGYVSSSAVSTDTWFDHRGNAIKTQSSGSTANKTVYDGAGRPVATYVTDGGGDTGWSDAGNVSGDIVLQQDEVTYDADGNAILMTDRQRFHDATATGALGDPSSGSGTAKARVSDEAMYYDAADRQVADVNVGTNGGTAYTRPSSVPTRSDNVLVTSYAYDSAGRLFSTVDPRGLESRTIYDALGRTTKTIADYVDGTPSAADDQTTTYTYDGNGNTLSLTAVLPSGTNSQTTQYVYGATTGRGDAINSNDVLIATRYPDPSTGSASTGQQETYTTDAAGEPLTKTDRNGNVHTYTYDVLGRQTSDSVTTLGSGVDGAVRRVETAYNGQGNAYLFTSYDNVGGVAAGGTVVNQVLRTFNGLGQVTTEYQAVSGAVDPATTPKVQYAYETLAHGSRLTSMTYPNGRVVGYNYGTSGGLNDTISRLSSIADGSTTLESYQYLGLGTVVTRSHPENGLTLSYVGTGTGDGGDQYTGLDRFGRVVYQKWTNSGGTATDEYTYTYDRDGNVTAKANVVNSALSETYTYDGLNRLTASTRNGAAYQSWSLDPLGNMSSVTTGGTAQSRTNNSQNQLTTVGSNSLAYDGNGNTTTDEEGRTLVYDAWNRLVEAKSGSTSLIRYAYDALGRQVKEESTAVYFSTQWQRLEDRNASNQIAASYAWSPVYVNALIARDRDTDGNGTLDERLYSTQDANWNVTGIVNTSGTTVERFSEDAYGKQTVYDSTWTAATDAKAWRQGFQGGFQDTVLSNLILFDHRVYNTDTMRWVQEDPFGYVNGLSLSQTEISNPFASVDPEGTVDLKWWSYFIGYSVYDVAKTNTVDRWASEYNAIRHPIQTGKDQLQGIKNSLDSAANNTVSVMKREIDSGGSVNGAVAIGSGYFVSHLIGTDKIASGLIGLDIPTAQQITNPWQRAQLLSSGTAQVSFTIAGVTGKVCAATEAEARMAAVRRLGQEGESAVGLSGPKTGIQIPGTNRVRFPDAYDPITKFLDEVKNRKSLSFTQQLRDYDAFTKQNGGTFNLWVRPSTKLSGPLQDAIKNGSINLKLIPGIK